MRPTSTSEEQRQQQQEYHPAFLVLQPDLVLASRRWPQARAGGSVLIAALQHRPAYLHVHASIANARHCLESRCRAVRLSTPNSTSTSIIIRGSRCRPDQKQDGEPDGNNNDTSSSNNVDGWSAAWTVLGRHPHNAGG